MVESSNLLARHWCIAWVSICLASNTAANLRAETPPSSYRQQQQQEQQRSLQSSSSNHRAEGSPRHERFWREADGRRQLGYTRHPSQRDGFGMPPARRMPAAEETAIVAALSA